MDPTSTWPLAMDVDEQPSIFDSDYPSVIDNHDNIDTDFDDINIDLHDLDSKLVPNSKVCSQTLN